MSIIVKKYIKLHLNQNEKKHYVSSYFRCSASLAIWYIMFLFKESWADRILECSGDGKLGLGGDEATFMLKLLAKKKTFITEKLKEAPRN